MSRAVQLEGRWLAQLAPEFEQPYMTALRAFLLAEKRRENRLFRRNEMFNAFAHTPLEQVKVVILARIPTTATASARTVFLRQARCPGAAVAAEHLHEIHADWAPGSTTATSPPGRTRGIVAQQRAVGARASRPRTRKWLGRFSPTG